MKKWFALTCPCCGFRFPLKKFDSPMKPIDYPVQIVTGGGRAKGFKVEQYLQWATLPSLKQTAAWNSILCLYDRLGAAYDNFYQVLGFLSPEIKALLEGLQKSYASAYLSDRTRGYASTYSSLKSSDAIAEIFSKITILKPMQTSPSTHFLEAYALSNAEEKTKDQQTYYMKGIPIHAYLSENGEFRWVPATVACSSKENTKDILEVLKKMPEDRRTVWASRLDRDQTKTSCPILRDNTDVCQEFDEFCAAYDKPDQKRPRKNKGGDVVNE